MRITIHKGSHGTGGSCIELSEEGSRIIIDTGLPLGDETVHNPRLKEIVRKPGRELIDNRILPDISGLYHWDPSPHPVDGIIISHPHLDHPGLLPFLRRGIPLYAGKGTRDLFKLSSAFSGVDFMPGGFIPLTNGVFEIIGGFKVTPFLMNQSSFDSWALIVERGGKKLIYSGDFREHGRKAKSFYSFLNRAPQNADALILEGTLVHGHEERLVSEKELEGKLLPLCLQSKKLILFEISTVNTERFISFYKTARKLGRTIVVDPYTALALLKMKEFTEVPHPSSHHNIRVLFTSRIADRLRQAFGEKVFEPLNEFEISGGDIEAEPHKYMLHVRPTMLYDLKHLNSVENSLLIYSMGRGGLGERAMEPLVEMCRERNVEITPLNTGEHAPFSTLRRAANALLPKTIIPIHTFYPEMYHELGPWVTVIPDGSSWDI